MVLIRYRGLYAARLRELLQEWMGRLSSTWRSSFLISSYAQALNPTAGIEDAAPHGASRRQYEAGNPVIAVSTLHAISLYLDNKRPVWR